MSICGKGLRAGNKLISICQVEGKHERHIFEMSDAQLDLVHRAVFLKSMGDRMFDNLGRAMKNYVDVMKEADGSGGDE